MDLKNYIKSAYKNINSIKDINAIKNYEIINNRPAPTDSKNEFSYNIIKMYEQFIRNNIDVFHGSQIRFY